MSSQPLSLAGLPPQMIWLAALALVWFVLRRVAARSDEKRRAARDERMAALMAEREAIYARQAELATEGSSRDPREALRPETETVSPPSSLAALVTDSALSRESTGDRKPPTEIEGEVPSLSIERLATPRSVEVREVIKVRCRSCGTLNPEREAACAVCGKAI